MKFESRGYKFILEVSSPERDRPLRPNIIRAARKTLESVPKKVLTHNLNTKTRYALSLSIVTNRKMQFNNKKYRKKDRTTDVLSFSNLPEKLRIPEFIAGDIFLSTSVIRENARRFDVPFKEELSRMVVHGILHVFGYDHELSKAAEKEMFALQEKILKKT